MLILGMRKGRGRVGGLLGGGGFGDQAGEEEVEMEEEEDEGLAMLTIAADACILTKCLAGGGDYREFLQGRSRDASVRWLSTRELISRLV